MSWSYQENSKQTFYPTPRDWKPATGRNWKTMKPMRWHIAKKRNRSPTGESTHQQLDNGHNRRIWIWPHPLPPRRGKPLPGSTLDHPSGLPPEIESATSAGEETTPTAVDAARASSESYARSSGRVHRRNPPPRQRMETEKWGNLGNRLWLCSSSASMASLR